MISWVNLYLCLGSVRPSVWTDERLRPGPSPGYERGEQHADPALQLAGGELHDTCELLPRPEETGDR